MQGKARQVLNEFYGSGPVVLPVNVVEIANAHGIDVLRADFGKKFEESVFGYIAKNKGSVRIYVNKKNAYVRRRFTIAHELGHYFLHHDNPNEFRYMDLRSTKRTSEETEANRFAEELLMPEEELRQEYANLMFPTAERLSEIFQVSKQAMKYRLSRLGLAAVDM